MCGPHHRRSGGLRAPLAPRRAGTGRGDLGDQLVPPGRRRRGRRSVAGSGGPALRTRRPRSQDIELVEHLPIATPAVDGVGAGSMLWRGAHHVEVTAPPGGGSALVAVETGRSRLAGRPSLDAGLVVNGRTVRRPHRSRFDVLRRRFEVSAGVFWPAHPRAATRLAECVLEGLDRSPGERAADLFAGAGLFTVLLADRVGPKGSVVAMERSGRACADAARNAVGLGQVEVVRSEVSAAALRRHLGTPDIVVLDPAREGAGTVVMGALTAIQPAPRRIA